MRLNQIKNNSVVYSPQLHHCTKFSSLQTTVVQFNKWEEKGRKGRNGYLTPNTAFSVGVRISVYESYLWWILKQPAASHVFWWTVPLNRQITYEPITVIVIFLRITTKHTNRCCKAFTGFLGFKHYHTQCRSAASFLFPIHTGSCRCVWSRRRSLWGCVGQKRRSWRAFPVSMPAWSPTPGQGRRTSSRSSKTEYWRSRRRRSGWSRTSFRHTHTHTHTHKKFVHKNRSVAKHNTPCSSCFYAHYFIYTKGVCGHCNRLKINALFYILYMCSSPFIQRNKQVKTSQRVFSCF